MNLGRILNSGQENTDTLKLEVFCATVKNISFLWQYPFAKLFANIRYLQMDKNS